MKKSPETDSLLIAADQYFRGGDHQKAGNIYAQILTIDPVNNEALFMTGIILFNAKKYEPAEKFLRLALKEKSPMAPMQAKTLGDLLRAQSRGAESMDMYKKAIQLKPDYVEAIGNLASLCLSENRLDEALFHCKKALALKPDYAFVLYNMGAIHELQSKFQDALSYYEKALSFKPDIAFALSGVGRMLQRSKKPNEAFDYFKRSVVIQPTAEAYAHMGEILQDSPRKREAEEYYKIALSLKPDNPEYLNNLGGIYSCMERFRDAYNCYKRVLDIQPDNPATLNNMASSLKAFSQLDEAIACHIRSLELRPKHAPTYTNLLLAMVYSSSVTAEQLFKKAKEFGEFVADPLLKNYKFDNHLISDRKIRIGYVSPDFRAHSVNYFFEPLLNNHNRDDFEIFGYSNVEKPDAVTNRLQSKFDCWRDISELDDDKAADLIHEDKIDILIDLAGHTGRNRLLVFARKPAPVQATWLGYPATTGVKAIDYRIVDGYAAPEGAAENFSIEKLYRLPEIFCCYSGRPNKPPVIDHPPFDDNGYITFGCFNNFAKVTDDVLAVWGQILHKVPNSRLMLEIGGLDEFHDDLMHRLGRIGLPADRLVLLQKRPENQYVLYNKIDIALDPFPCNGGTTSMDTMWMGVPMISLAGDSFVSRMGVTILTNAGLPQFIANTKDEYIEKAITLAQDKSMLRAVRQGMRGRVEASPLMDQARFARNMEDAYKDMWKKYLEE